MSAEPKLDPTARRNAAKLVVGKTATKLGDTLTNPKTVLTWLLTLLGAPGAVISMLVPIRESGSMLPQLFISGGVKRWRLRKRVFALGALAQALSIAAMGAAALLLPPTAAGVAIVAALGLFAIARAYCSISAKDVLGRTIPKGARGRVNGLSKTASGVLSTAAAVALLFYRGSETAAFLAWLLIGASLLWVIGAVVHAVLHEEAPAQGNGGDGKTDGLRERLGLVLRDRRFRDFIIARALLLGTALASPLLVVLGQRDDGRLAALAAFIVAGGVAGAASSFFWGRLADRASHLAMSFGGALSALTGAAALVIALAGPPAGTAVWLWPLLFLLFNLGYTGVRLGRKTWVVDAAEGDARTDYVSASNTLIAVMILALGIVSAPLQQISPLWSLGLYVALCAVGAGYAMRLKLT